MKKILVPIDFSNVTELVIENAKLLAKSFDAELKIIHVVDPIPQNTGMMQKTAGGIIVVPINYESLRDEFALELKNEHRKMFEIKQGLSNEKIQVGAFLLKGNVSEGILSQIEEYSPDMIVMGSHGHGYIVKTLLGSITVSVLKHAKCPVIIIPSKVKKRNSSFIVVNDG